MPIKERFVDEVRRVRVRVEGLRKEGLSDWEIARRLMEEHYWPTAISKVMGVSGQTLRRLKLAAEDVEFIKTIETMRRDPNIPVLAREIDDYAWWRRVIYDVGAICFWKLSPLADIEVDPKHPEVTIEKLKRTFTSMFETAMRAKEIEKENQALRSEVEEWRMVARILMPQIENLKRVLSD